MYIQVFGRRSFGPLGLISLNDCGLMTYLSADRVAEADRLPSSRSFEEIDESWQRTTQAIVSDDPDALRVRMAELDAESGIPVLAALLPSASPLHEPLNGFDLDHGS